MSRCLRIAPTDNVAVALEPVAAGIRVAVEGLLTAGTGNA